ncbi:MAG: DNA polymerase III subunit gamma/tau [Bacilli bacterium]|nr:DNA polymerase III subunit gamma/tau [Bacilli bacterium]
MAYKALYRTYRPQTFEEVAGQKHIVKTLKNALATNKIAHAYLFCGPRGTGKTTMAKLFAKALNCQEGIGHICNKCSDCVEITNGSHPDVIEIDAASNNGVEQVRDLIDKVNYLPIEGKYKVYIIDEVHMMTTCAFNALLKTIEEPPAHVIFILATTEPHNILPTILSRCQRYDFTKVSDADIEERIVEILEKEGIEYDKDAVRAIIALADGGVRDALSILDQVLAFSGNTLNVDDVYSLFGLASKEDKISFIKFIANGDVTRALARINAFAEGGVDLKRLTAELLEILKDVLILKKTKSEDELTTLSEEEAEDLSAALSMKQVNEMIGAFLRAQIDFKTAPNVKTMFDIVILKLCTSDDSEEEKVVKTPAKPAPIRQIVEEPKVEKRIEQPAPVAAPEVKVEPAPQPIQEPVKEENVEVKVEPAPAPIVEENKPEPQAAPDWLFEDDSKEKKVVETDGDRYELDDDMMIKLMVTGDKELRKSLSARWKELDSYLGHPTLGDIVALIKDGKVFIATKNVIVLEYDFEKLSQKANIKENGKKIADILSKMVGHEVFTYAVSRSESVRLVTSYHNLRQISQLPRASEVKINIEELK